MNIRIAGYVDNSVVDGPGLRLAVFTQGCPHNCKGCHNPTTHDLNGGYECDTDELAAKLFENPLADGLTVSGGEPFLQCDAVAELCRCVKNKGYNVIIYTGYLWEQLTEDKKKLNVLRYADIVIDGRFEESLKSLELRFKGSKNQRIVDVKKSLSAGHCVTAEL